jgi:Tol biopolymer transport system component
MRLNPAPSQIVLLPTGAGEPKQLTHDDLTHAFGRFVDGGTRVVFEGSAPGRRRRLYVQDLSGGAAEPITPEGVYGPLSPDGKLVAFEDKLYAIDRNETRPVPGIEPADRIEAWSGDSKSLVIRQILEPGDQRIVRLDITTGRRTPLYEIARPPGARPTAWFTITPDGSAYFYSCATTLGDLFRVTGLK